MKVRTCTLFAVLVLTFCGSPLLTAQIFPTDFRLGYMANLTHTQALIGVARGDFAAALGAGTKLVTVVFNAGPSIVEALFAGKIDVAYLGPSPAINGFLKSKGKAFTIVAGATEGGASLVVQRNLAPGFPGSMVGGRIASPQLGNTQDVALRTYLRVHELKATVLPTENSLILPAFQRGDLAGAWVPEPWATRLVLEGGGTRVVDERDLWSNSRFPTTVVVVATAFATAHPQAVASFVSSHRLLTEWIGAYPEQAQGAVNSALASITGRPLGQNVLSEAWKRFEVTSDLEPIKFQKLADNAKALLFLRGNTDLSGLFSKGSF